MLFYNPNPVVQTMPETAEDARILGEYNGRVLTPIWKQNSYFTKTGANKTRIIYTLEEYFPSWWMAGDNIQDEGLLGVYQRALVQQLYNAAISSRGDAAFAQRYQKIVVQELINTFGWHLQSKSQESYVLEKGNVRLSVSPASINVIITKSFTASLADDVTQVTAKKLDLLASETAQQYAFGNFG